MNAWIVILAAGVGSYLLRVSMIVAANRVRMPAQLDRASALVSPAALAALAATSVAASAVNLRITDALAALAAVGVAVVAVVRTRSPHAAILAGMPTLWILTAVLPG